MRPVFYKFLNGLVSPHFGFKYRFRQWMPAVKGNLEPCQNGYHVMKPHQLCFWSGLDLYAVKYKGDTYPVRDKVVCRQVMLWEHLKGWNEQTMRFAATDFVYQVLPIWEAKYPGDTRVRQTLIAARDFARGWIDDEGREQAEIEAWDLVDSITRDSAFHVARAAAYSLLESPVDALGQVSTDCRITAKEGYQHLGDVLEYEVYRKPGTRFFYVVGNDGKPMNRSDSREFVYCRLAELFGNIILDYAYNGNFEPRGSY